MGKNSILQNDKLAESQGKDIISVDLQTSIILDADYRLLEELRRKISYYPKGWNAGYSEMFVCSTAFWSAVWNDSDTKSLNTGQPKWHNISTYCHFIESSTYELLLICANIFRYSCYVAEGYMWTDITLKKGKKCMNNNFRRISHNVQKCLIHFILHARNSVFIQFLFYKKV